LRILGVTNIEIGDNVKNINDAAFSYCNITSITIPSNVENIESGGFEYCDYLTKIVVNKEENSIAGAPWSSSEITVVWNP
jgi:hypothetical protein